MHAYREADMVKALKAVEPSVSEEKAHVAFLMSRVLPGRGDFMRVLCLIDDPTPLPCVLATPKFGYMVYTLAFSLTAQGDLVRWKHCSLRQFGQCLLWVIQAAYDDFPVLDPDFPYAFVGLGVEWDRVQGYVLKMLAPDGRVVVAQRMPYVPPTEAVRVTLLKTTRGGYCIETTDVEKAELVVFVLESD